MHRGIKVKSIHSTQSHFDADILIMTISMEGHPATSSASPSNGGQINPSLPSYDFSFTNFLKREYRFGLDPNRPFCKAFREGHCPLGNDCPDKHQITHSFNNLVCKHWLRGLCKKGDQCEFFHEYNLCVEPCVCVRAQPAPQTWWWEASASA